MVQPAEADDVIHGVENVGMPVGRRLAVVAVWRSVAYPGAVHIFPTQGPSIFPQGPQGPKPKNP